jgi:hypothetical protein
MSMRARRTRNLRLVRWVLPATIAIAGLVTLLTVGPGDIVGLEVAGMLMAAGLSVYLLNWLYRLGVQGDAERLREQEAREHFSRHGRWPDKVHARD